MSMHLLTVTIPEDQEIMIDELAKQVDSGLSYGGMAGVVFSNLNRGQMNTGSSRTLLIWAQPDANLDGVRLQLASLGLVIVDEGRIGQ